MRAHFNLPSVLAEDSEGKPPIHVKFEIPYFTVSGIQVNYLCYLPQVANLYIVCKFSLENIFKEKLVIYYICSSLICNVKPKANFNLFTLMNCDE